MMYLLASSQKVCLVMVWRGWRGWVMCGGMREMVCPCVVAAEVGSHALVLSQAVMLAMVHDEAAPWRRPQVLDGATCN